MRKPDPAFYLLACQRNGVTPSEAVFLDDIGLCVRHLRKGRGLLVFTVRTFSGQESQGSERAGDGDHP